MNQLLWHLEPSGKCQGQQRRGGGTSHLELGGRWAGGREEQDGAEEPAFPGSRALLGPRSTLEEPHFVVRARPGNKDMALFHCWRRPGYWGRDDAMGGQVLPVVSQQG